MPNILNLAFNLDQPAASVEFSKDGGTTWAALTLPATGNGKTASIAAVLKGTYAAGQLVLRPVGYPAAAVSNTTAVTVVNNVLATPTGTSATGTSTTAINVVVSSIANQTAYRLLASDTVGGTYAQIYQGSTASFAHTGLTASQTKFYKWQYVGGGFYDDSALGAAFSGVTNAALANDYALLVVGDSTAALTNTASAPFSPTLIPLLNNGIANNGYTGTFTSTANTAIAGQGLNTNPDGTAGGLMGTANFAAQVAGRYVAGKYNVLVIEGLLNTMANEVAVNGETGAAARVLVLLKQYITQIRADNANWRIITGSLTKRTNGTQPGQENQRPILNQALVDGFAAGTLDVQALARFGQDTRLSTPGPNASGTTTAWFVDWVHYTQQTLDTIVCPSFRDAFLFARFGIPQDAPYTGAATGALLLSGFTALPVRAKSANVSETVTGSGIYNVPGGGAYGLWLGAILFDAFMPAAGTSRVGFANPATDALNAIMGLTASTTLTTANPAYDGLAVSFYQHEDNRVLVREGATGAYVATGFTVLTGEYLMMTKIGSALTLTKTANGTTFTTIYTFAGSYTTDMYVGAALELSLGKLYAPQGLGLTIAAAAAAAVPYNGALTANPAPALTQSAGRITPAGNAGASWGNTGAFSTSGAGYLLPAGQSGGIGMKFLAGAPTTLNAILSLSAAINSGGSYLTGGAGLAFANIGGTNYCQYMDGTTSPTTYSTITAPVAGPYTTLGGGINYRNPRDGFIYQLFCDRVAQKVLLREQQADSTWVVLMTMPFYNAGSLYFWIDVNGTGGNALNVTAYNLNAA